MYTDKNYKFILTNMKRYLFLIIFIFIAIAGSKGQDKNEVAADRYLTDLFENRGNPYDTIRFSGYGGKLKLLKTPLLNKLLPDYRFYSTIFLSNYMEYIQVETALAFSISEKQNSRITHSPVFTSTSTAFINLFYGLQVNDSTEEDALAREIMYIFSSITYKGRFDRITHSKDRTVISYELWHGKLCWRIYDFYFDSKNQLTQIEITNPKG